VISGYLSDKMKIRKPFILMGYGLSGLTKPLFAWAVVWPMVLAVRVVERIGKGLRNAPRDAIIADDVQESLRGKAYGFQRAMDGIGSVLGALMAFFLLPVLGYKNVFLFAFIPGILSLAVIFFIKEKKSLDAPVAPVTTLKGSFKSLPRNLKVFILLASVFALGHFGYAFFLLKAQNIQLDDQQAILLYIIFYGVYSVSSIPMGILSDRWGRKPVLVLGYTLFGLIALGMTFAVGIFGVTVAFIFYGLCYAMIDATQRAYVADLAPVHLKATALGSFHTAIGFVALPGGYFAGWLWDQVDPAATFWYGFSLAAVTVTGLLLLKEKQ